MKGVHVLIAPPVVGLGITRVGHVQGVVLFQFVHQLVMLQQGPGPLQHEGRRGGGWWCQVGLPVVAGIVQDNVLWIVVLGGEGIHGIAIGSMGR